MTLDGAAAKAALNDPGLAKNIGYSWLRCRVTHVLRVGYDIMASGRALIVLLCGYGVVFGYATWSAAPKPGLAVAAVLLSILNGLLCAGLWMARDRVHHLKTGERVAVIACDQAIQQLSFYVAHVGRAGVRLVPVNDDQFQRSAADLDTGLSQVLGLGRRHEIDRILLAGAVPDDALILETVRRLKVLDIDIGYCSLPALSGMAPDRPASMPFTVLARRPIGRWGRLVKGFEDRVLAAILIVVLAPLLCVIALTIKLDSKGPVIFSQRRHGRNGIDFRLFKFRTMTWQPDSGSGAVQTRRHDHRITRVGAFLRNSSLDELPQLLNLLNGTMSLVGPRPHPVAMLTQNMMCEDIVADYPHRHRVKPGITGWAQITGHRGAVETTEQVRLRVAQDIYYIENWSLLFDLKILLLTPYSVVFHRENAF